MVYKWQYSRDKILSANLKGIKPGAGRTSMHPLIEQQVHQEAMQERRDGICVTLAGIAQNMRTAVEMQYSRHQVVGSRDTREGIHAS